MDLRIFIEPQQGASFEDQLAAAQATEECGFDAFFRSDHLMAFAGEHSTVVDSPGLPKPVQRPHPPIIIGGAGARRTPALAARHAAEFNLPFHPLSAAADSYGRVRRACEEEGRSPDDLVYSAALTVCCGKDGAEVGRRAARIGRDPERIDVAGTPAQVGDRLKS